VVTTREGVAIAGRASSRGSAASDVVSSDPVSLVAAEIHHGLGPAGINATCSESSYSKHVPTPHLEKNAYFSIFYWFCSALNGQAFMPFEKAKAQTISSESGCLIFDLKAVTAYDGRRKTLNALR
jgi:hypothetical protein